MFQLIRDLHQSTVADGEDQAQKGTQLLEIYALEIQMYNETKNFKKLKVTLLCDVQSVCRSYSTYRKSTTLRIRSDQPFRIPV